MSGTSLHQKISASLGNLLEWYDFALYGYFAEQIGDVFFPHLGAQSLLASFGVFAVGFLSRPLGAMLFGFLGDRLGRAFVLKLSFPLMFCSTVAIGLLPTYQQVGMLAPWLLTMVRILQGMSVGSQYTGSITYLAECEDNPAQRAKILSYPWIFSNIGFILASLVTYVYNDYIATYISGDWQWRLPFLTSLVNFLFLFWQRSSLPETPDFEKLQRTHQDIENRHPFACAQRFPRSFFATIAMCSAMFVSYYVLFVFLISYLPLHDGLSHQDAVLFNGIALVAQTLCIPLVAGGLRFIKIKTIFYICSWGLFFLSYPAFALFQYHDPWLSLLMMILLSIICAGFCIPVSILMVDAFPTQYRLAGTSIGYNISAALFGGTAPMASSLLIDNLSDINAPAFYMMLWCLLGILGVYFIRRAELRLP